MFQWELGNAGHRSHWPWLLEVLSHKQRLDKLGRVQVSFAD